MNPQRNNNFDKLDLWTEGKQIVIRKMSKFLGTIFLNRSEARKLHTKLSSVLGKVDWKKQMEKDRDLFIGRKISRGISSRRNAGFYKTLIWGTHQ